MKRTIRFATIFGMILLSATALFAADAAQRGGIVSYSAQVADDGTQIRSAPGSENDYATGTLRRGDIVEIFFKNGDGWCAIRPPEGSYSWVNGNFVRPTQDGGGVIVSPSEGKEVPVRVGADSVLKSTSVQVGLKSGRTVTILGETTLTGGKTWYKISPPAGEFRWIHESRLVPDDFLAQLPDRLTREGELTDSHGTESAQNAPVEELPDSILRPAVTENAENAPNADADNFHLELARLNRDLFSAVERSGAPEVFDLLADRAANLFSAATSDEERTEAQKLYQRIKAYRGDNSQPSGAVAENAFAQVASQTIYRHPAAGSMNASNAMRLENQPLTFTPPNAAGPNVAGMNPTNPTTEQASNKRGLKFAFAGGNGPFSGFSRSAKKGNNAAIVPPANYQPLPAAAMVAQRTDAPMIGEMISSPLTAMKSARANSASPLSPQAAPSPSVLPGPSGERLTPEGGSSEPPKEPAPLSSEPFLAESPNAARPVSAILSEDGRSSGSNGADSATVDNWVAPKRLSEEPIFESGAANDGQFDAAGLLGYFPDRPDGYPPYALVRNDGDKLVILSYVTPEKGKEIDSFVGKNVGVIGKRGWFKHGTENRKLVTAKSIFPLDE